MTTRLKILDQDFLLIPEKAIYWEQEDTLLIADLHFGKITHFRKAGIAIPDGAALKNFNKLQSLLNSYPSKKVIFLGDLFHSELNTEWLAFKDLIKRNDSVSFHLITGNHDILPASSYSNINLTVHKDTLKTGPIILSHEPLEDTTLYNLCGHIHPGVRVTGSARQSLRLPCFYFGEKGGILPAFGEFTGLYIIHPKKGDRVYMIVNDKVIDGSPSKI